MLKIWPNDAAVQNDEAYTRLLLLDSNSRNDEARMTNDEKENAEHRTSAEKTLNPQPSTLNELEQLAANLVAKNPRSMPHRTLLALARLKQHRATEALAVYENINVARGALTPPALAVHAAVLAANGHTEEARAEAAQIKPEQLLAEEKALLGQIESIN